MRILVIDDTFEAMLAIQGVLSSAGHVVASAYEPDALPGILAGAEPFDLAMVDMVFTGYERTGLGALRILREQSPATKTLVRCSDNEDNRQLHLLAAFTLFDPLALVSRRDDPNALGPMIEAIERGEPVDSAASRYRPEGPPPTPLDQLLHKESDLAIWRALTKFDKRPDAARAAFVAPATVDHFIADMYPVAEALRRKFGEAVTPPADSERGHKSPLIGLTHFARLHKEFFRDPDLEDLLKARWKNSSHPQTEQSQAVRRSRSLGRRRSGGAG